MSTEIGQRAEAAAAQFLERYGFQLHERNWRTRWCEIDIIAQRANHIYFIEVKYRSSADFGTGFDYITQRKLRQMHFAAEFWLASHPENAATYHIAAIELTGNPPQVLEWLPDVV
jgi:uncharacterized protein (TIGR00252 family)